MSAPLRYLSVCSGIEVAALAWVPLGWSPVLVSEIEAFPREVLRIRHGAYDARYTRPDGSLLLWGDFGALRMRHLRRFGIDPADIDVLVGGTPCQGFSVAGLRGSLSDPRGGLSLAFLRLAHAIQSVRVRAGRPALIIVWENVPGVLSTPDNAIGCFLGALVGADDAVLPGERPLRGRSNKLWRWRPAGSWPVLDEDGNETGKFVERAEAHVPSWPRAGMVAGPRGRAAWRVLDAQHFGLAQRRERVFLVGSLGEGLDPAAVLFERQGVRGHHSPSGEAAEDLAATLTGSVGGVSGKDDIGGRVVAGTLTGGARAGGGYSTDDVPLVAGTLRSHTRAGSNSVGSIVAFGGNRQSGARDLATALNAHGGPHGRLDFETETFVVAPQLANALRAEGFDASEDGTGRQPALIAFSCKDHGADAGPLSPTLRAMNFDGSHANGGGQVAIAFNARQDPDVSGGVSGPLDTDGGTQAVLTSGVRRLMPVECERLQGVPDHFTQIPWKGRPPEQCPDGPRYRALGNAYPRPVLAWIGHRINAAREVAPVSLVAAE